MSLSSKLEFGIRVAVLGLLASGLAAVPAAAATASNSMSVSVTVQASCTVTASTLSFGNYTGSAANATSAVSVTCSNSTAYNVGLSAGTASGATVSTRKMTGPASALLSYSLYSDPSRTVNWGQTAGSDTVPGVGSGAVQALTVYGQTPAGQFLTPGSYTDTITATITY
jgi:spore coat protein U-like protein